VPKSDVYVHPLGLCDSLEIGAGTRIWAFAHVLVGARIGSDCNIGEGAFVEGGASLGNGVTVKNGVLIWDRVTIEDDVFLGPGVVFTNDLRPRAHIKRHGADLVPTTVLQGATLGAGTIVVCGVTIGRHAFSAAGSVIARDVADHAFVAGNPARQRGWVCVCAERLPEDLVCAACRRTYRPAEPADATVGLVLLS
jgi:UDP-2-acetamido-3-amino-2,3-dideoxy-glucuronate N-acetyltransferase